jgi:RNA polymerase sigma-70 factor (ECF subfamily)
VSEDSVELDAPSRGDKQAWDHFVRRYARVIFAAIQNRLGRSARPDEVDDVAQEVFLHLCKADYRVLRSYDPAQAGLST